MKKERRDMFVASFFSRFLLIVQHVYSSERDSILFLVDASRGMFAEQLDQNLEPFFFSLKCAVHVFCDKVISSNSDFLGIVFYGTVLLSQ